MIRTVFPSSPQTVSVFIWGVNYWRKLWSVKPHRNLMLSEQYMPISKVRVMPQKERAAAVSNNPDAHHVLSDQWPCPEGWKRVKHWRQFETMSTLPDSHHSTRLQSGEPCLLKAYLMNRSNNDSQCSFRLFYNISWFSSKCHSVTAGCKNWHIQYRRTAADTSCYCKQHMVNRWNCITPGNLYDF